MRIAVIGSGVSGLGAAWLLSKRHSVDLYEADDRLGGHACTHDVEIDGVRYPADVGFMVFNDRTYPNLIGFFDELGVSWRESDMSFSVRVDSRGLEWAGSDNIATVFAQPRNALDPRFLRMVYDILRMSRDARRLLDDPGVDALTLEGLLDREGFGESFRRWYLIPVGAAIWSTPSGSMLAFPAKSFLRFCDNHGLLHLTRRHVWRTVVGGSREYVSRAAADISGAVHLGSRVGLVRRRPDGIELGLSDGSRPFYDQVVIATHASDSLRLLADPDDGERSVLSSFRYQPNPAVLHSDPALLPHLPAARASWNYRCASDDYSASAVAVTYDLTRLQGHAAPAPILLTLDPIEQPQQDVVSARFEFEHPVFTREAVAAQGRLASIQGSRRTWYAGAWQQYGFHEDGLLSAVNVAERLGVVAPWNAPVALR